MSTEATGLAVSVMATATSTAATFNGDQIMAWVMLGINIVTLISNTALAIYRKWRDKNKDLETEEPKQEEAEQGEGEIK